MLITISQGVFDGMETRSMFENRQRLFLSRFETNNSFPWTTNNMEGLRLEKVRGLRLTLIRGILLAKHVVEIIVAEGLWGTRPIITESQIIAQGINTLDKLPDFVMAT